jgi:S1-C subfamily serine protease
VEAVRGGGSAELAGIEEGDVIRALGGVEVVDVEEYAEVLDMQIIGKTITVRVRRGDAEVDLQVKVGSRTR